MISLVTTHYSVRNEHGITLGTIELDYDGTFVAIPYVGKRRRGLSLTQAAEYIAPNEVPHNCNYGQSPLGYFAHCMTDGCGFDMDGLPTRSDAKDIAMRHDARTV